MCVCVGGGGHTVEPLNADSFIIINPRRACAARVIMRTEG